MGYVYRYLDGQDNILYIGSTKRKIVHRINEHRNEDYYKLSKNIDYSEVEDNSHCDYESKLIDLYRPKFNKLINNIHYKDVELDKLNWIKYDETILPVKDNGKKGKTVFSKNNYITIKDSLLSNNSTIEDFCFNKIKCFSGRQYSFCYKSINRDISIFYVMLENNITPDKCASLNISDIKSLLLSSRGLDIIKQYISERKGLNPKNNEPLFLSGQNKRITTRAIQNIFKKYFIEYFD